MKNLHFCTKDLIRKIKYEKNDKHLYIKTYRTGFIPGYIPGEIIRMNERIDNNDTFLKAAKVISLIPIQYRDIGLTGKQEILEAYSNRKFHPLQWFFEITLRKWSLSHNKVYEETEFLELVR